MYYATRDETIRTTEDEVSITQNSTLCVYLKI
jgi:hypothetical protein